MKIKINGIYGKYNTSVDLDKKCTIFIGENGIGKSTTMKIVSLILSGRFVDLLNYDFDSVELIDGENIIKIMYLDLFPTMRKFVDIVNKYEVPENKSYLKKEMILRYPYFKKVVDDDLSIFKELVKCEIDYIISGKLDYNDTSIRRKIQKKMKDNYFELGNELFDLNIENNFYPSNDLISMSFSLINIITWYLPKLDFEKVNYYPETIFSDNEVYKNVNDFIKKYKNVFYISSVKDIYVNCLYNDGSYSENDLFRKVKSYDKIYSKTLERLSGAVYTKKSGLFKKKHTRNTSDMTTEQVEGYMFFEDKDTILKEIFKKNSTDKIINNINYSVDLNMNKGEVLYDSSRVNIGGLLFKNYYSKDIVSEFLRDYYIMLKKMVDHEYDENDLEDKIFYKDFDLEEKYHMFIKPLLPKQSIFREPKFIKDKYYLQVFTKFIKDNLDKYMNYKNEKVDLLNSIFKSYFKNKTVTCTPAGLVISINEECSNELGFEYLSEGEKRIIIIFILGILCDTEVFLLDEPETSLSVLWQQSLVNDMLDKCDFKNLLIATQSPLIVSDDKLLDYVVCLPGGENNE